MVNKILLGILFSIFVIIATAIVVSSSNFQYSDQEDLGIPVKFDNQKLINKEKPIVTEVKTTNCYTGDKQDCYSYKVPCSNDLTKKGKCLESLEQVKGSGKYEKMEQKKESCYEYNQDACDYKPKNCYPTLEQGKGNGKYESMEKVKKVPCTTNIDPINGPGHCY
ncbi:MAG: hypothetical protein WC867_07460 [Candidatus Pacearchaeota archaeon]|jgi:hypothetical protein